LFFGLKAAVLAIVLEAVVRIGRRALKNRALVALAAVAFAAIFFFNVPFPIIVFGGALIGFGASVLGYTEFAGNGHGPAGTTSPDADSLLGEETPDHARPNIGRSLMTGAVWLACG
jgi:chromate transporter